jgi:hypothetical protein
VSDDLDGYTDEEGREALALMGSARKALAEAKTLTEVKVIKRQSAAANYYARQMRMGNESVNLAAEIRLLSELKLSEVLRAGQNAGEIATGGRPKNPPAAGGLAPTTLAELDIKYNEASDAHKLADAYDEATIHSLAEQATKSGKWLSREALLREARYAKARRDEERRQGEDLDRLGAIPPTVELVHGDFREVLADLHDVDAVITDPPYPREFLPLYGDLATWADKVLSPDGVLCVLTGHMWLPEVLDLLGRGRPYRWTCAYMTPGSHASVWGGRNVLQGWKPMVVYGKGPGRFFDVIRSEAPDRSLHHWGQNMGAFQQIVDTFTRPGQLVVDPFLGGGTTAAACALADRRFVGCDVDAEAVETSRTRLEQLRT